MNALLDRSGGVLILPNLYRSLCALHAKAHKRSRMTADHYLVRVTEETGIETDVSTHAHKSKTDVFCLCHGWMSANAYCFDCRELYYNATLMHARFHGNHDRVS